MVSLVTIRGDPARTSVPFSTLTLPVSELSSLFATCKAERWLSGHHSYLGVSY